MKLTVENAIEIAENMDLLMIKNYWKLLYLI